MAGACLSLCALPEIPVPDGLHLGIELPSVLPFVKGEEKEVPFQVAPFIESPEKGVLAGKEDALSVHGEETIKKRKGREIAPRPLQPQIIRAPGTHQSGVLILQISLPWTSNAEEKAGQGLVCPAPGKDPPDLVVIIRIMTIQPFNPFTVRKGTFIDEGRNHTELAILGPGNESVLFVTHKTQQYLKELHRIPGPARVQYPLSIALRAFARLVVFGNSDANIQQKSLYLY